MKTPRHPATSPNASTEAVRQAPQHDAFDMAGTQLFCERAEEALRSRASIRGAAAPGTAHEGDSGAGVTRPLVTSSPRPANSEGADVVSPALSDRGLFQSTQPRGTL
jgi:hypothetical protein